MLESNDSICYNDGSTEPVKKPALSYGTMGLSPVMSPIRSPRHSFLDTIREVISDDFRFDPSSESCKMQKSLVVDGMNIATMTQEDIDRMSPTYASEFLLKIHLEGYLMKKGFRGLRMWKRRFFVLNGNELVYFDKNERQVPRRRCEITPDCQVTAENVAGRPYAFSMVPYKGYIPYMLEAFSLEQRDLWVHCFLVIQMLVRAIHRRSNACIHDVISLQDTLGKGHYGVVRLGQVIKTGSMCAVKLINKRKVQSSVLSNELSILQVIKDRVCSPDLVQIWDIYEDEYLVYIVMEYLGGGDLRSRIIQNGAFSEMEAAHVIARVGSALLALHREGIWHLDVKPENVIYECNDQRSTMKLADFGCCLEGETEVYYGSEMVGTVGFMAPEVIQRCEYSAKADVYSLGVMLYLLLMGYPPYVNETMEGIMEETVHGEVVFVEEDWSHVSEDARVLVRQMLEKDPRQRVSMETVMASPWLISSRVWIWRLVQQ